MRRRSAAPVAGLLAGLLGLLACGDEPLPQTGRVPLVPSTRVGNLTVVQALLRVDGKRAARVQSRLENPASLPRGLTRGLPPSIVALAAAGEVEPGTFVVSVAVINRVREKAGVGVTPIDGVGVAPGEDLEERFARTAIRRLTGIRGKRVSKMRATDLLSTAPPASFCGGALPGNLPSVLRSAVLHAEGAPIVPWAPGQMLRSALGLAYRACGLPLPGLLLAEEVDRLAREIVAPATTMLKEHEECDGKARLGPRTLTNPPHPDCADVEWITPIPPCADDLAVDVVDVATEQPIGSVLFGDTTQVTFFFGLNPMRLMLRACNRKAGSAGGETVTLDPSVSWGG